MKKLIIAVLAIMLVVCISIGATLAYLFVKTDPVVNTFAYGDINIELKEHKYEDGDLTSEEVTANKTYKIIPGVTEEKDPFVRVKSGSEKCYVYVTVENSVKLDDGTVVASVNINNNNDDWESVDTNGDTTLYRYKEIVDASSEAKTLPVFTEVSYDAVKIRKDNIAQVKDDTITVIAYAYQATNVEQTVADAAVKEMAFPTATN